MKNFEDYYILIDDFKNPFNSKFGYDTVGGVICGIDYIKDILQNKNVNVYLPNYEELTSEACWCLVGWALITKEEINSPYVVKYNL
jgi:hypothetical protein